MTQLGLDFTAQDRRRLAAQQARVLAIVRSGAWYTLAGLSAMTGDPEASVSARLRECRKLGYTVERRRVRDGGGQWAYRLVVRP